MTLPAPTYDLVLLLDPKADDDVRAKIVADTRATVEAGGDLVNCDEWGERALAYAIERHANAEYHLLQFHAGSADLLTGLDRTLRITDGVLRFRIIKLKPGVPDAPDMRSSAAAPPRPVDADVPAAAPEVQAAPAAEPAAPAAEPAEPAAAPVEPAADAGEQSAAEADAAVVESG
jgi:small subunit ribosomal protein S6